MFAIARAVPRRDHRSVAILAALGVLCASASLGWFDAASAHAEVSSPVCDLYASSAGSDANNGSKDAPVRTLRKLLSSLAAGQVGCLQSGETFDSEGNLHVGAGETHGSTGQPITITSTESAEPATITHSLALEHGVSDVTFTHVDFDWAVPKPWVCWNAEGNVVAGEVLGAPGRCVAGQPYSEAAVQIALGGNDISLTYDDITSDDTDICINLGGPESDHNLIEHDRIHNCGPTVEAASSGFPVVNEEWGWHSHGVYDYARNTVIDNNYIYDNSRDGILFYGGGEGAVAEHNILDHNGAGIWFGDNKNDRAAWNIVTNSTSPRGVADYGIGSYEPGSGNVATDNCLDNNQSGEIEGGRFAATENKTATNPLYVNAERHEYTLQAGSPCVGYGPDTAQPTTSEVGGGGEGKAPSGEEGKAPSGEEGKAPTGEEGKAPTGEEGKPPTSEGKAPTGEDPAQSGEAPAAELPSLTGEGTVSLEAGSPPGASAPVVEPKAPSAPTGGGKTTSGQGGRKHPVRHEHRHSRRAKVASARARAHARASSRSRTRRTA
jgi:hypothetical protein